MLQFAVNNCAIQIYAGLIKVKKSYSISSLISKTVAELARCTSYKFSNFSLKVIIKSYEDF